MSDHVSPAYHHAAPDVVAAGLAAIRRRMAAAAASVDRVPQLVAVSKTYDVASIEAALAAGQRVFGENRVQEAQDKYPALKARYPDLELHLIGPLQTNKVKPAVALFDVIETLDRDSLAEALAKEMDRSGRRPACLIQVNTGEEPQKAGIAPRDALAFLHRCRDDLGLPVRGFMCIPPVGEEPALHFALLKHLADRAGLDWRSMGMSGDFETALQFGATHVRVGSAIFGARG